MTTKLSFNAQLRDTKGSAQARRLRKQQAMIPAVVYGADKDTTAIMIDEKSVTAMLGTEGAGSQILDLKIDQHGTDKVILKAVQRHASAHKVLHLDLQRIQAKEAISIKIPLHFVGEEQCAALKEDGVAQHLMKEVEVHCLPGDLPPHLEVSVADLGMDESIHLSQIALPKGVTFTALTMDPPHDDAVVSIHHAKVEVEPEETTPEEGDASEEGDAASEPADDAAEAAEGDA